MITCENGHRIADFDGPLEPGELIIAENFSNFAPDVEPFLFGSLVPERPCPECEGRVFRVVGLGYMQVHTADGWRP